MPIYVDESGGLSAGAMTMAGVNISEENADRLLGRFRAVTGLRGELKGSRIDLVARALFFELLERFDGRAHIVIYRPEGHGPGEKPSDFEAYVALLRELVEAWMPETGGCTNVIVDEGRYDTLVLERVRDDITAMLAGFGGARLMDSARCAGVQIADVVANSFFNIAVESSKSRRISVIVGPFIERRRLRSHGLTRVGPVQAATRAS